MEIEEFTFEDAGTIEQVVALNNAVAAQDSPWTHPSTPTTVRGMLRHGWDGETPRAFVARDRDVVVGTGELWVSEWDNLDLAWLDLAVHPDDRRRGLGTELLQHLLAASKEAGRTSIGINSWDDEAGIAFASRHGFERKSQAINRRQYLADVDRDLVDRLFDEAQEHAAAYDLVRLVGRTPDELIEQVAVLTAAINDAPTDDLDIEDEVFPPERVHSYEEATLGRSQRFYRLLARHRETGELAGQSVVAVEAERPAIGHQHDTSVVASHRGHRLGLLLKAAMLRWLHEVEPRLETIDTWNAESNDHMIAVNDQLGYRVVGRGLQFQRSL